MSKKDRSKLEKKRRKERQRQIQKPATMAYRGNKYKKDKNVDLILMTEVGIYECYVALERKLTDHEVRRCLEELIRDFRSGNMQFPTPPNDVASDHEQDASDQLTRNIRECWQVYLEKNGSPSRDNVVGVLRTILGSIENWGTINPESRGYLRYLEGFLSNFSVNCEDDSDENVSMLDDDEIEDPELLAAGRAWIHDSDQNAYKFFGQLADEMIKSGQGVEVAETCQQLMGESMDPDLCKILGMMSIQAQHYDPSASDSIRWALNHLLGM